ncbi:EF-hand domain pair [Arabidopsis thaliana x Arabidopsis arenosa]|uniref:EF-hand domain pair n=1 Tax=Arabidopsis thaliana x Arabidopsis arenosa TaxID=1240361 RepID=A0A8T2CD65_9BRAS|nr:EF-hand domain pair [Arabidopsis thaliana x Arabidopsis arenosa]
MARLSLFLSFFSLIALISGVNCRVLSSLSEKNSILISDGVQDGSSYEFLSLDPPNGITKNQCIHVYGFLPCADNVGGYVFQVFSFGCILIIGEYFLTKGRSKLFLIFEVGFYGGIIFPLLTMFPRIALILSTGLVGSREMASSRVGNIIGVTVGYSVFALTMQWGACILFGLSGLRPDQPIESGENSDVKCPRTEVYWKNLLKKVFASVEADPKNKKAAGIMLLTILPFILVSFSEISNSQSWNDIIVLISLIISASATFVYFFYSYFDRADQEKSLDHARFELMSEVHKHLQIFSPKSLIRDGQLNEESLKRLFDRIDVNKDGKIQVSELKDLTVEFGMLGRVKCHIDKLVTTLVADFDRDGDGEINEAEFEIGIKKWLNQYKFSFDSTVPPREDQAEENPILKIEKPKESLVTKLVSWKTLRAALEVILGMLIVIYLARPFMMNIQLLSESAGVPSFYVVFVVIPLARNLKNTLSAHFCRNKDKARITSDTFSEIYRDVTMNNLMGISIILAIVYARELIWDYTTEVLIIVIVGLLIGIPAYVRSTYPFWICVFAFALYFISLVVVYFHFMSLDKGKTFTFNK